MNKKRYLVIVGIVAAAVLLTILFDTMLANHRPAISSLETEPEKVLPSGKCQIVCNATDPDGDELSYGWSADGGGITGEGDTVTWTAPNSVGSYNVTVMVIDSRGGGVTDYVTIPVRTNKAPTINSLIADADWTTPSGSLQVTCNATDPDGDELSYEWTATGGNITGTGAVVSWTAPQEIDVYYITVVVKDGHGSADTRTLPVSVVTGEPPSIEDLLITADHCYLKTNTSPYKVGQGKEYDIQCVVADTGSELSYDWSCTGGEISEVSEDPSIIAWTAPNTSGKVTITVIVSDMAGNKSAKSLLLDVASCSSCTFPGCSG
jgi:hypothetical protein